MNISYGIVASGISIVISVFMIVVSLRASRRGGLNGIVYLALAFAVILADNVIYTMSVIGIFFIGVDIISMFLISDLLILLAFYFGAVRGR